MANYNKSFNFRNGVQVDTDDLIVRGSLVGIGTTIPRSDLDVHGNVNVTGLVTTRSLYVAGIATFNNVNIGTGITIYGSSGIISATFYGDGSNLEGLPTSKWNSYQSGIATSIYADVPFVGIGTTAPTASLQIGGRSEIGSSGVAISTDGHINASGIITANSFYGEGTNITAINASNVTLGNLPAAVFPPQITVSGIATIASLDANLINSSGIATISQLEVTQSSVSGISTVGFATVSAGYVNNLTVGVATITDLTITGGSSVSNLGVANINSTGIVTTTLLVSNDANVSGFTTLGSMSAGTGTVETLISTNTNISGIVTAVDANITGTTTIGLATGQFAHIGVATIATIESSSAIRPTIDLASDLGSATNYFKNAYVGEVNIGVAASNKISTRSNYLTLDSSSGRVIVDDNLEVTGIATITGDITLNTAIITTEIKPDQNHGATIGTATNYFETGFIGDINIGVGNSSLISTRTGNLTLDAHTNQVIVDGNLQITGITSFDQGIGIDLIEVTSNLSPNIDMGAGIGTSGKAFTNAFIGDVTVGAANSNRINTRTDHLILDSTTGQTIVDDNFRVTGFSTFTGNVVATNDVTVGGDLRGGGAFIPNVHLSSGIGTAQNAFSDAFINDVTIGIGNTYEISTRFNKLELSAANEVVEVSNNLIVSGYAYFTGVTTVVDSLVPDVDQDAALGSASLRFSDAYVDNIQIGVGSDNKITTSANNLTLAGASYVETEGDFRVGGNALVVGVSTLTNVVTLTGGAQPATDKGSNLGNATAAFNEAHLNEVRIGVGETNLIDTREGDLRLGAETQRVVIDNSLTVTDTANLSDLYVNDNTFAVDTLNARVGVGTSVPSSNITVLDSTGNSQVEVVSNNGTAIISVGSSVGAGVSFGKLQYVNKNISIVNRDTGGISFNINDGSGAPTEFSNYNFVYSGNTLLSIGYSGVTGINKSDAEQTLDVNGSLAVSENARIVGIITIGTGDNTISFGSTGGVILTGIMSASSPDTVAVKGNVFAQSGVSTFHHLEVDNTSVVTIGSTCTVVGVLSARTVAIGLTNTNEYSVVNEFSIDGTAPYLIVSGDAIFDGSILISEGSKLGIGTTGFSVDSRNINFGGASQSAAETEFGILEIHGGTSVYGEQSIFNNSFLDSSQNDLSPQDKTELTDYVFQHRVGINTFQPRACLDLGGSRSPMILPSLNSEKYEEYTESNETASWMVTQFNDSLDQTGNAGVPGTLFFNVDSTRPEVGINTGGQSCGIATLTSNVTYPNLAGFIAPMLNSTERQNLVDGGVPDGSLIYNTSSNRMEMKLTIGITTHWVGFATIA